MGKLQIKKKRVVDLASLKEGECFVIDEEYYVVLPSDFPYDEVVLDNDLLVFNYNDNKVYVFEKSIEVNSVNLEMMEI